MELLWRDVGPGHQQPALTGPAGYDVREGVWLRESGRCLRCGRPLGEPRSPSWSCHHRQLRSQGGSDGPENRAALCGSGTTGCHGWAHHNRADAAGWVVPSHGDPARVPVLSWDRGLILLDGEFCWSIWTGEDDQ